MGERRRWWEARSPVPGYCSVPASDGLPARAGRRRSASGDRVLVVHTG